MVASGEFRHLTEESVRALRTRMMTYLQSIKGTAAFVAASDYVSTSDFETYVNMLDISNQLPGISGIGLIVEIPDVELDDFANLMRAQGQPEFVFRRLSDTEAHYVIKYIEPREANAQALGLDLTFAPERARVLERARDTKTPLMTPPIQLVQEDRVTPGFALFMPIYANDELNDKSGQFLGWINAAFIADNLLVGLTSGQDDNYKMEVVDGPSVEEGVLIFDGSPDGSIIGEYSATYQLEYFGRTWTLAYSSTPRFDQTFRSYQPLTILIAGLSVSAFMVSVLRIVRLRGDSLRDIAELRDRQIEAREEENRSIVENAVISVLLIDGSDRVLFANQAAQKCFGFSEAEMSGMQFSSIASETDESQENYNALGKTKSGQTIELDLQLNNWLTSEGHTRTTVIIRDLTEQNSAQREVKRNKTLYDMALQGSEIGVFDVDLTTGLSEVSETWCRIMGYENNCNGMDTQQNFMSRIHPEDADTLKQADTDCIEGRTERSIVEYRLKARDGGWSWMRSDAVIVERGEDGRALRMIGTQTNVTELRHDRNALEVSENRFRQVVSNAPIGMALMDDVGKFIGVNSAFCQLAGVKEEELIENGKLADLIPYEERKKIYEAVANLMSEKDTSVYTAEHQILHANGDERWGLLNVSWSFDKNSGTNFFIAQIIDITDQKKLDLIKDEFVSTVSHELRTPLTSIKGALGLLTASKDLNLSKAQARLVDIASSNADRLTDIVNDILDLKKISSGEVTFDFSEIDLNGIITAVVREMSPFAATHDSTMQIDVPQDPLMIFADQGRTKQVLTNLISNACKYSSSNSAVIVKAEWIDDLAIVYVQNVGSGVPESFRPRIFQAFSQADSSDTRAKGGTGLGLNISRQIVLRHGGEIGFESIPGNVTVFWFTIPLSNTALHPMHHVMPSSEATGTTRLAVLHLEDDNDFAEVVSGALHDFANVTHAKSIASAKEGIRDGQFDVVLLDWNLPDGDAVTLLDDIAKLQPHARIIGLSANGDRNNDPRLFATMVKGRTDLAEVVASVNKCRPLAS